MENEREVRKKIANLLRKMSPKAAKATLDYLDGMLGDDFEEVHNSYIGKIMNGEFSREDLKIMNEVITATMTQEMAEKSRLENDPELSQEVDIIFAKYKEKVDSGEITESEARKLAIEESMKRVDEKDKSKQENTIR